MRAAVQELAGFFETSSGLKLVIEYGTVAKVAEKVTGDDPIDVAILTKPFLDELVRAGKMAGGTAARLARVPSGLAVRQGAPKPDIKTVEAFKKTLLDAKFITYGDPSVGDAAGVHMAKTLETLGLASETRPKTRLITPPPPRRSIERKEWIQTEHRGCGAQDGATPGPRSRRGDPPAEAVMINGEIDWVSFAG